MEGLLERINCTTAGINLEVNVAGTTEHFIASSMNSVLFISHRSDLRGAIPCTSRTPQGESRLPYVAADRAGSQSSHRDRRGVPARPTVIAFRLRAKRFVEDTTPIVSASLLCADAEIGPQLLVVEQRLGRRLAREQRRDDAGDEGDRSSTRSRDCEAGRSALGMSEQVDPDGRAEHDQQHREERAGDDRRRPRRPC